MNYIFKGFDIDIPELERKEIKGLRHYIVKGDDSIPPMVSITTVLSHSKKQQIEEWKNRVGHKEAQAKMDRTSGNGTALHFCVETYLNNKEPKFVKPLHKLLFQKIKPTLHRINNIYAIEQPLYSVKFGVAGTPDIIAEFDGIPSIIDTKTSDQIKKEEWIESYFIQCSMYSCMVYELTGVIIKDIVIMMVSRDLDIKVFKRKISKDYVNKFRNYLKQFRLDNGI